MDPYTDTQGRDRNETNFKIFNNRSGFRVII